VQQVKQTLNRSETKEDQLDSLEDRQAMQLHDPENCDSQPPVLSGAGALPPRRVLDYSSGMMTPVSMTPCGMMTPSLRSSRIVMDDSRASHPGIAKDPLLVSQVLQEPLPITREVIHGPVQVGTPVLRSVSVTRRPGSPLRTLSPNRRISLSGRGRSPSPVRMVAALPMAKSPSMVPSSPSSSFVPRERVPLQQSEKQLSAREGETPDSVSISFTPRATTSMTASWLAGRT